MSMTRDIPAPVPRRRMPQSLIAARNIVAFLTRSPTSLFGLVVLALLILVALFAPLIATHDPYAQNRTVLAHNLARRFDPEHRLLA